MRVFLFLFFIIWANNPSLSWANYTLHQNAILPSQEDYLIRIASQMAVDPSQVNVLGIIEKQIAENMASVFSFGLGSRSHQGAHLKYTPFPDWRQQPALAFLTGILHVQGVAIENSEFTFRLAPIISKEILDEKGVRIWSFYMSSSFNYKLNKSEAPFWQLIGGMEMPFYMNRYPNMHIGWEIGLNLSSSFNYLSLFMSFSHSIALFYSSIRFVLICIILRLDFIKLFLMACFLN